MSLKISQNSEGSTCAKVSFFNKVAGQLKIKLRMIAALFKKRLCHRCFPVNFAKFLRASLLQNTSERLLLTGFLRFFRKKERENGWLLLKRGKRNSDPRVTSSNPRVMSSNPRVTSLNPQVTSSNPRVTRSNPRVQESLNH